MEKKLKQIKKQMEDVQRPDVPKLRRKGLPKTIPPEELKEMATEEELQKRKAEEYVSLTVTGSTGKKYRIAVPKSFAPSVPKVWQWDERKYRVADMLAQAIPISQIISDPSSGVKSRATVYGWLEHPEFREHVDGLILETGTASKRFRLAGMKKVADILFNKLVRELESVEINDKSIGPFLTGYQSIMKHIAQEKEEFVEQISSHVEQKTTIEGDMNVTHLEVDKLLQNAGSDEERRKLQEEFNAIGDAIIRSIKGE